MQVDESSNVLIGTLQMHTKMWFLDSHSEHHKGWESVWGSRKQCCFIWWFPVCHVVWIHNLL